MYSIFGPKPRFDVHSFKVMFLGLTFQFQDFFLCTLLMKFLKEFFGILKKWEDSW